MYRKQQGSGLIIVLLLIVLAGVGAFIGLKFLRPASTLMVPMPPAPVASTVPTEGTIAVTLDTQNPTKQVGSQFTVDVMLENTSEAVNVISTNLQYPKDQVKVKNIQTLGQDQHLMWISKKDSPDEGTIQLITGAPNPGVTADAKGIILAKVTFEVTSAIDDTNFAIAPTEVKLISNETNKEIKSEGISFSFKKVLGVTSGGSLSFTPTAVTVAPGCNFDLIVNYDTGGNPFVGIDAVFSFDTAKIQVAGVNKSDNLPDQYYTPQLITSSPTYIWLNYLAPNSYSYNKKGTLGKVTFKAADSAAEGSTIVTFKYDPNNPQNTSDSNIVYSQTQDILSSVTGTTVTIKKGSGCSFTSIPSTTPQATSTPLPSSETTATTSAIEISDTDGDTNKDGKIDLLDISVIFSHFNKVEKSQTGDFNHDGKINALDFSALVHLLIKKKVISV